MKRLEEFGIRLINIVLISLFLCAVLPSAQAAKGGGGGGKVSVTDATPSEAFQDVELDVIISGSGFDVGTTVSFLVTGTSDDSQIEVLSNEYLPSTGQLKTRIKVKGGASAVYYDIEATTSRGRRGKGSTMFQVKEVETACTGYESQEPEIAFLTALDTSGDIHTQDLYLSSGSGCDTYRLLEDAVQKLPDGKPSEGTGEYLVRITDLRLDVEGDMGVVTWRDRTIDPIPQIALKFTVDSFSNVIPDLAGPELIYVADEGYGVLGADVRISDLGEIELVMIERAPDDSEFRVSYVNVDSGAYSLLTSGNCPMQDELGECFIPSKKLTWWNEDGSEIYLGAYSPTTTNQTAIARIQRVNEQWQPAKILMTHQTSLQSALSVIGVRSDGLLAYERMEVRNKRSRYWVTAAIFPNLCVDPEPECLPSDGIEMAADGTGFPRGWTRNGGMLFIETGPGNQRNLREYSNPFTGTVGRLNLRDVDRDQRDASF